MNYQALIEQMTLEEKCSLLSGGTQFTTKAIERLGIEAIFLADGPHGVRKQAGSADHLGLNPSLPATCYPVAATVANSWDISLAEEIGEHLGMEAAALGVSILLGPGLNIKRNPLCGRNFEYFSEDPYLSGKMAAAYIRGIQSKGIAACPKHYAVNSQETFRMSSSSILDERTLYELYLTGFEIAVKEGNPKALMSSYNLVNDQYTNDSKELLHDILVNKWGFDGMVVTDWGGSNDRVQGLIAGNHLEMPATRGNSDREILEAVKTGRITEELVDKRLLELLSVWQSVVLPDQAQSFDVEEHHKFARKAAEQSIVLLKNEDNILPLKKGTKVAVIGDFARTYRYQGAGSSLVNSTKTDSPLAELRKSELDCTEFAGGFMRDGKADESLKRQAVELAGKAEVVLLYMGLDEVSETEGMERKSMKMNDNQIAVLEAVARVNTNIVVIITAGASVEMPWDYMAKAVVHGYLGGQAGAGAMVNVITGKVNPSGKLAETYPVSYGDIPGAEAYPSKERTSEHREGLYVGYRYFDRNLEKVKYPFGHGLSYTEFAYDNLIISPEKVSCVITNTGQLPGTEIVQLYVSCKNPAVYGPVKELKGFAKVSLAVKESRQVEIDLDDKAFRYYNAKTHSYEILGGEYEVLIGASAADIRLKGSIQVSGTNAELPFYEAELPNYWKGTVEQVSDAEFAKLLGREIPPHTWNRKAPLDMNQPIACLQYAKNPLARFVFHIIDYLRRKADRKGAPDLNILFIYNMPFRGIAKMMGGMVDMRMVQAIMVIVNGNFFRGAGQLISAFRKMRKEQKKEISG